MFNVMSAGLGGLAMLSNAETRSISAENLTGERGGGARFEPLIDDIAFVAHWYQSKPHGPFPSLPAVCERWSR